MGNASGKTARRRGATAPDVLSRERRKETVTSMLRTVQGQAIENEVLAVLLDLKEDDGARVLLGPPDGSATFGGLPQTVGERRAAAEGAARRLRQKFRHLAPDEDPEEEKAALVAFVFRVLQLTQGDRFTLDVEQEANGLSLDDPAPGDEARTIRELRAELDGRKKRLLETYADLLPELRRLTKETAS